jgi:hypothetical protein
MVCGLWFVENTTNDNQRTTNQRMPYSQHTDEDLNPVERNWVFMGAVLLSFIAGFVNAALLEFFSVPVSHISASS